MDENTCDYIDHHMTKISNSLADQFDKNIKDRINAIKEHVVEETNLQLENLNLQDLHWCEKSMYMSESLKGAKKQHELFKESVALQRRSNVIYEGIAKSLEKIAKHLEE